MARRRSKPTPKKLAQFLEALAETGNVLLSCDMHNLDRRALYRLRKADEDFRRAWDEALEQAADHLEAEARRRALDGLLQKKFTKDGDPIIDPETGEQYVERVYSDTLLIFLLKGARPEKYRDRQQLEHTGPGGEPLPAAAVVNVYIPDNGRDSSPSEPEG